MCAVIGFSTPTITRGFDYQVNVTLVDESVPLPAAGDDIVAATGLSIFCKEKDALPRIVKAGDVLTCHRVAIQVIRVILMTRGLPCFSRVSHIFCCCLGMER